MEQHPVRGGDQAAVVGPAAGVALRLGAVAERRGQFLEVGRGQRGERAPGLDQQPHHDPFGGALDHMAAVVQVGGRRGEPGEVAGERAAPGRGEQPADLAVGQVVVAGPAAGRAASGRSGTVAARPSAAAAWSGVRRRTRPGRASDRGTPGPRRGSSASRARRRPTIAGSRRPARPRRGRRRRAVQPWARCSSPRSWWRWRSRAVS